MIENLNRLSFREFGDILTGLPAGGGTQNKAFTDCSDKAFVRYTDCPVYLERLKGMPVLTVSVDGINSIRRFYLDKPVVIHSGVWFRILILGEQGCVCRVTVRDSAREQVTPPEACDDLLYATELTVGTIYTLFYQEQKKGFLFHGEQYKPYELVYVDSGSLHSVASGQDCLLRQGEMVLYTPNQWHMQYAEQEYPVSFITISFDMECRHAELLGNRKLTAGSNVKRLLSRILEEHQGNAFLRNDLLQCSLKGLLVILLRQVHSNERPTRIESAFTVSRENQIVESAQRYITDHLDKRLSVEMVAQGINVSTSYMSALFRKHLGIAPSKYIGRVKLAESKRLIQNGAYNLSEISHLMGYATPQHFSRSFKMETGITPSEYARSLQ